MIPAHQRFCTNDQSRRYGDLGLIIDHEFPTFEGFAQARFKRQTLNGMRIHFRRIKLEIIFTFVLGAVHRDICVFQQGLRIPTVGWECRDPNTGAELAFLTINFEGL